MNVEGEFALNGANVYIDDASLLVFLLLAIVAIIGYYSHVSHSHFSSCEP